MPNRILFALLGGFAATTYTASLYSIDEQLLLQGYTAGTWLILLIAMLIAAWRERELSENQFIGLRKLLRTTFFVFIVANAILLSFQYFLYNYIVDPCFVEMVKEQQIAQFIQEQEGTMPKAVLEEQVAQFEKGDFRPTIAETLKGFFFHALLGFVLSLAVSAVFKRSQPDY